MAIILTKKGEEVIVDEHLYEELNQYRWHIKSGYAFRHIWLPVEKKKLGVYMHRQIKGLTNSDEKVCDHINRNKLDNREENLRIISRSQNAWNLDKRPHNTSGYTGVCFSKGSKKNPWMASICVNNKQVYLGIYPTPEEANKAYLAAKTKYHKID